MCFLSINSYKFSSEPCFSFIPQIWIGCTIITQKYLKVFLVNFSFDLLMFFKYALEYPRCLNGMYLSQISYYWFVMWYCSGWRICLVWFHSFWISFQMEETSMLPSFLAISTNKPKTKTKVECLDIFFWWGVKCLKKQILTFFSLAFIPAGSCRLEGAINTVGTSIRLG